MTNSANPDEPRGEQRMFESSITGGAPGSWAIGQFVGSIHHGGQPDVVHKINHLDIRAAYVIFRRQSADDRAELLGRVRNERAIELLARIARDEGFNACVGLVARMDASDAGRLLQRLARTERAGPATAIIGIMDVARASERMARLFAIDRDTAAKLIEQLAARHPTPATRAGPRGALQLIAAMRLGATRQRALLTALPTSRATAQLVTAIKPLPDALAAVSSRTAPDIAALLEHIAEFNMRRAAKLFGHMDQSAAATQLELLTRTTAARLLQTTRPTDAAPLLTCIDPNVAYEVLGTMRTAAAAAVLEQMKPDIAARLLDLLPRHTAGRQLAYVYPCKAVSILLALPPAPPDDSNQAAQILAKIPLRLRSVLLAIINRQDPPSAAQLRTEVPVVPTLVGWQPPRRWDAVLALAAVLKPALPRVLRRGRSVGITAAAKQELREAAKVWSAVRFPRFHVVF